ncbi:hypothetical protein RYY85_29145, partial [Klebsiella pneumoniae]|nr:hypothetical protein [Klebsiella pneumoniae]
CRGENTRSKCPFKFDHNSLNAGEVIPEPVKQIPKLGGRPLSNEQGLNKIAEIRAKFGLGRGRNHG